MREKTKQQNLWSDILCVNLPNLMFRVVNQPKGTFDMISYHHQHHKTYIITLEKNTEKILTK